MVLLGGVDHEGLEGEVTIELAITLPLYCFFFFPSKDYVAELSYQNNCFNLAILNEETKHVLFLTHWFPKNSVGFRSLYPAEV